MLLILAGLVSVVIGVEHATDIEIHKVEVYEIPWQEEPSTPETAYGPPQQGFEPPQQQYGPPQQEYGPPEQGYDLPKPVYGPPPKPVHGPPSEEPMTTTDSADITTTGIPMTTNDTVTDAGRFQERRNKLGEKGVYYVYHPEGLLQRVNYATEDDVKKMEYTAKLKYENVEPIREPIYSYDSDNFVYRRIK